MHTSLSSISEWGYLSGHDGMFSLSGYVDNCDEKTIDATLQINLLLEDCIKNGDWIVISDVTPGRDLHRLSMLIDGLDNRARREKRETMPNVVEDKSSGKLEVAPQFRMILLVTSGVNSDTTTSVDKIIPLSLALRSSRIAYETVSRPTTDVLLPTHDGVAYQEFDLITHYSTTSGRRDSIVASRRGYSHPKLLRTLADEIHRPVTEEQSRQFRRMRFSLCLLHGRITTYLGMHGSSAPHSSVSLQAMFRASSSILRRRIIHHHCVFALGGDNGKMEIVEPGVDHVVIEWLRGVASHVYLDGMDSTSSNINRDAVLRIICDTITVDSAVDPRDALYPYEWKLYPPSLVESLVITPVVEPPPRVKAKKGSRRKRQKRMSAEDWKRLVQQGMKKYQVHAGVAGRGKISVGGGGGGVSDGSSLRDIGLTSVASSMLLTTQDLRTSREASRSAAKQLGHSVLLSTTEGEVRRRMGVKLSTATLLSRLHRVLRSLPDVDEREFFFLFFLFFPFFFS